MTNPSTQSPAVAMSIFLFTPSSILTACHRTARLCLLRWTWREPHGPARGGGPLDRVDQLVALDGEVEVDVEGPTAAQGVRCARVGLGDVVGLTARSALGSELVLGRHRHRSHGLRAFARVHLVRSEAEGAIRPDHKGAFTPVDLQSVTAGIRGNRGNVDRHL